MGQSQRQKDNQIICVCPKLAKKYLNQIETKKNKADNSYGLGFSKLK